MQSTPRGGVRKRPGHVSLTTTGSAIIDSVYGNQTTTTRRLVCHQDTILKAIDSAGTVSNIKTGVNATALWEWISAHTSGGLGPLWAMNGTDTPQAWDGGAATVNWTALPVVSATQSNVPNGQYLIFFAGRVWVAGMSAFTPGTGTALDDAPSAVVFSNVRDPRDFPVSNVVQFEPRDGEPITAIGPVGPFLGVFKKSRAAGMAST